LIKAGRTAEQVAATFGMSDVVVKRTLALGNLLPRIRGLYRSGDIDVMTVRQLTLASLERQREWLALVDDPNAYAPRGHSLKNWLFGGTSIPVSSAIFDMASYEGEIVSDLFGEERYFASSEAFWKAQNAAIEALAQSHREAGWKDVIILESGSYFSSWEYERRSKSKGGKTYIAIGHRGEVSVHEGYLSLKDIRAEAKGEVSEKPKRPELSAPLLNYVDLHRHAAVRAKVAADPSLSLRLVLAHAIHGSSLWTIRVEPQRAASDAIAESIENSASEALFDERRRAVLQLLGFDPEAPTVTQGDEEEHGICGLVMKLIGLADEVILQALAIVMAETLEAGSHLVELLGQHLTVDMAETFAPDDALLDLVKDRELLDAMLAEVAGKEAASANAKATGKVKRQIIADCLKGEGGRTQVDGFVPRFMAFPPAAYTARGGVATVSRAACISGLFEPSQEGAD
jgi:ParB family chromosome partitioning protein